MNKLNKLISSFIILLFCTVVMANDHEEKKEEGGHDSGGGGHEAAPVAPPVTLPPWIAIEGKIQELSAKIRSKEESLQKLLEEKNHLPENSPHVKETVKLILKEHAELKNMAEDRQKNISMLNYRYPERNAKKGRTYDRIEVKSIDEMEQAMGVDGKLSRNLQKMRTQYGTAKEESKPQHHPSAPAKVHKKGEASIEDAGAIIINK